VKDRDDEYYLRFGRLVTVLATFAAIGTALIAAGYANLMDYLQTLFGFFNAPLFATFILGMFWKRMTPAAGWIGLVSGTSAAVVVFVLSKTGAIGIEGQGMSFVAAGAAFVVDIVVSYFVTLRTEPRPEKELVGLVYQLTPKEDLRDPNDASAPWYQQPVKLAGISLVMVVILNVIFW
jgi:SSS family solute:Na+ symporter